MDCQYSGQLNHKFPFLFVFFLHSTYVLCMYICVGCFTKAFLCSNYFTCIDNVYDFCQKIQALLVSKRSGSFARSFQKKFKQLLQPWRLNYMILALNESMKIFFCQLHYCQLWLVRKYTRRQIEELTSKDRTLPPVQLQITNHKEFDKKKDVNNLMHQIQ